MVVERLKPDTLHNPLKFGMKFHTYWCFHRALVRIVVVVHDVLYSLYIVFLTITNVFFSDVNFALVGYGAPNQKWPAVYTFNGKFNQFPGTAKNIHFDKKPEVENPKLSDKIEEIFKKIQIETGN